MSSGPEHANPYLAALERLLGRRILRPNEAARRLRQKVRTMRRREQERESRRMSKDARSFAMLEREAARREELARARATAGRAGRVTSPDSAQLHPVLKQHRLEIARKLGLPSDTDSTKSKG